MASSNSQETIPITQDGGLPEIWAAFKAKHFFEVEDVVYRAHLAADYAQAIIEAPHFHAEIDKSDQLAAQSEVSGRLFSGMVGVISNEILIQAAKKAYPHPWQRKTHVKPFLEKSAEAKTAVRMFIGDFVSVFAFQRRKESYQNLLKVMTSAAELVVDDYNLQTEEALEELDANCRLCTSGLVSEYMVMESLRGWEQFTPNYAPHSLDLDFATDILVQTPNGAEYALQVKSASSLGKPIKIIPRKHKPDLVLIAPHLASHRPDFILDQNVRAHLGDHILNSLDSQSTGTR